LAVVGFWLVLQQIPLDETVDPPSEVTNPPPDAVVVKIDVIAAVVTVGATALVFKDN
jgi:hypothetical protein